ncbi:hypothetical protein [Nocardia sputi]|uniref:hypothetical protein n=1 Tax=Nocardia sputi TaxID=2943705 RepID=UPI0020BFA292|nr:hypothetical protein [Nocardia sputi]
MRVGEVLNLRRGCVTRDEKLGMIFLSGRQLKTTSERAQRTPATVPWVINEHGAQAISVLQDLAPSATLFPFGKFGTLDWIESTRTRTKGQINDDLRDFVTWFNTTLADTIGHPRIRDDEHGPATGGRLRRTLACACLVSDRTVRSYGCLPDGPGRSTTHREIYQAPRLVPGMPRTPTRIGSYGSTRWAFRTGRRSSSGRISLTTPI